VVKAEKINKAIDLLTSEGYHVERSYDVDTAGVPELLKMMALNNRDSVDLVNLLKLAIAESDAQTTMDDKQIEERAKILVQEKLKASGLL